MWWCLYKAEGYRHGEADCSPGINAAGIASRTAEREFGVCKVYRVAARDWHDDDRVGCDGGWWSDNETIDKSYANFIWL